MDIGYLAAYRSRPDIWNRAFAEQRNDWTEARDQLRSILASMESGDAREPEIRQRLEAAEQRLGARGAR